MNPFAGNEGQSPNAVPPPSPAAPSAVEPASSPVESDAETDSTPIAWQPFTFSGVAAFSTASLSRVLLVQLIVGLLVGSSVVWFVHTNFSPIVVQAIHNLPEETAMIGGMLGGTDSKLLAEGQFLSVAIDLDGNEDLGQSSDLQIELHRSNFQICSAFRSVAGVWEISYPADTSFVMSPSILEPWWGAWHPIFYLFILLLVTLLLMVTWCVLALLYMVPVRLIAYYADRQSTLSGAWRLASAALMPGAFAMIGGIFLYGWQVLDPIGLGAFVLLHLVLGWIYLFISPCRIKRVVPDALPPNPFGGGDLNHTEAQSGD